MACLYVKNCVYQTVLDNIKQERFHWTRPDEGDGILLLVFISIKNAQGTRASVVVAKTELLST